MTAHWGIPDPAAVQGTNDQVEKAFRQAFFLLDRKISLCLGLPLSALDRLSLRQEVDNIGRHQNYRHGVTVVDIDSCSQWGFKKRWAEAAFPRPKPHLDY